MVLPSGCGEQNLVRLATNWVVANYLDVTEQLSDFIAVKVKNNIQIGMQNSCDIHVILDLEVVISCPFL